MAVQTNVALRCHPQSHKTWTAQTSQQMIAIFVRPTVVIMAISATFLYKHQLSLACDVTETALLKLSALFYLAKSLGTELLAGIIFEREVCQLKGESEILNLLSSLFR